MQGLTQTEAQEKRKAFGFNELPQSKPKTFFRIFWDVLREPMFILLISCAGLYWFLGDWREGSILGISTWLIVFITFYQYRKTEHALAALRQLSAPQSRVLRNGTWTRIASRELVPGDVISLQEGDRIPADALINESHHLLLDESILTGESLPIEKGHDNQSDRQLFSGTLILRGHGTATVQQTGVQTRLGMIGKSLNQMGDTETRLNIELKQMIRQLFVLGIIFSIVVLISFYIKTHNFISSLLNSLSTSMAILPEEFPVVLTVFLALGAWRLTQKQVLTRNPAAIESLGSATVLCTDKTGTLTQNSLTLVQWQVPGEMAGEQLNTATRQLLQSACMASLTESFDKIDKAIQEKGEALGVLIHWSSVKEFPFGNPRPVMGRIVVHENRMVAAMKGAPEVVADLCKMPTDAKNELKKSINAMALKGYRVLGVARAMVSNNISVPLEGIAWEWQGLIAFEDPIRAEVPDAIKTLEKAGIRVVMITGDYPATAQHIAQQIGLKNTQDVIQGSELDTMSDLALQEKISTVCLFARTNPTQKLRLVEALKTNQECVSMIGDGVNDAPALRAAHIGIAMGQKGTDVAREAASLVLLNDRFEHVSNAVEQGRRIYDNLQKAMSYIMVIHIPIILLSVLPAWAPNMPILLMPLHIVFLELIIDPVCAIAFENEPAEKNTMLRPPRRLNELFFTWPKLFNSIGRGFLIAFTVLCAYFLSLKEGHQADELRTIVFSCFILCNVFVIMNSLSGTQSMLSLLKGRNKAALLILMAAVVMLILSLRLPIWMNLFHFAHLSWTHLFPAFFMAFLLFIVLEALKLFKQ
ncbi:MAG: cation-translocating P-type ATPase [Chitinophagaceae bacterium]|nr:cation-translocating P-type ATPase [Chitinophagaceae bacterium]